jgi:hypothetical protein
MLHPVARTGPWRRKDRIGWEQAAVVPTSVAERSETGAVVTVVVPVKSGKDGITVGKGRRDRGL